MLKEQKGGAGPGVPGAGGDGHIKTEGMKEEAGAMKDEPGERAVEGIKDDPEGDLVPPQPLQNGQLDSGYSTVDEIKTEKGRAGTPLHTGQNGETKVSHKNSITPSLDTGQNGQLPNNKQMSSAATLPGQAPSPLQRIATHDGSIRMAGRGQQGAPVSMEPHFMQQQQQQSQIFVFSTTWANKAAELVQQGQYNSIIEFHIDQPGTKRFLQKHPLKVSQFNRQSNMPLYTMASMQSAAGPNKTAMTPTETNESTSMSSVAQWVQQQNQNLEQQGANFSSPNQMNLGFSPPGSQGNMMPPNMRPPWPGQMQPGIRSPNSFGPVPPGGPGCGGHPGFAARMSGCFPPGHALANLPHANLLHNKVPNENLTPEQRQRREEQLANLRKIQQMLFPEQHGGGGGMPPGMMHLDAVEMGGMMPPQPNMMGSPGMGSPPPPHMMGSPVNMMNMMQGSPRMGLPPFTIGNMPNMENMTPAQHEWLRLQQEYYSEKQRKQHMQQMQQMGMNMPGGPPPPSYFTSVHRRQGMPPGGINGPLSPTSANLNRPMPSPRSMGPLSPVSDPQVFMFSGPRPPMMEFSHPGLPSGHPSMQPDANFDPGMELGMPDGPGGMFSKDGMGGSMPPHPMQGKVGMPAVMHHVGNPEPFNPSMMDLPMVGPGTPTSNSPGPTKPPPSYAQAQKRKRSGEDVDELYKKLQPAPSPQQFSYLNQFDGQELTITKQLNMAYQEPNPGSPSKQARQQAVSAAPVSEHLSTQSPLSLPATDLPSASSCPTMSVASPLPSSTPNSRPSSASGHMTSMTATTTMTTTAVGPRLSHFEPALRRGAGNKQPMSNITSASLANLAKGVEHLSDQMQQKMMQGGPFHTIQVQGQMAELGETSPTPGCPKKPGIVQQVMLQQPITTMSQQQQQQPQQQPQQPQQQLQQQPQQQPQQQQQQQQQPPPQQKVPPQQSSGQPNSPHLNQQPTVNNTYVNATMSIGQLNIQSMNQPPGANYGPSMQVQQMNSEQHMGMGTSIPVPSGMMPPQHQQPGTMPTQQQQQQPGGGVMTSMTQQSSMAMMGGYMQQPGAHEGLMANPMQQGGPGSIPPGVTVGQMSQQNFPYGCVHPDDPAGVPKSMRGQPPGGRPMQAPSPLSVALNSPGYQPATPNPVGNANVQIQAKAPNTIQYLPAKPPASQASQILGAMRKDFDVTPQRFVQGRLQEAPPGGPPLRVVMPGGPSQQMSSQQMMMMQQSGHMTMQQMQSLQYDGLMMSDHMQAGPGPMQGGPIPGSIPGGLSPMQGGPMPGGPGSMLGPGHMQGGSISGGPGPMHSGPMQGGHGGMQGGPGPMPGSPGPMQGGHMQSGPGPMLVSMGHMGGPADMMGSAGASDMIHMQMQGQQMQGHMMGHPGGGMRPEPAMMMPSMGQPPGGAYSMQQFQQQQFSRPGTTSPGGMMHPMGRPDMGGPGMAPGGPGGMMMGPMGGMGPGIGPGGMSTGGNPNQFMNMMPNLP